MLGLKGEAKTSTFGAIIDIGSGSVGVGIVDSNQSNKLPEVIFAHREYMRPGEDGEDKNERLRQMREALFSASLVLSKDGLKALHEHKRSARIGRILVTCSSPWAHTISRNVVYEHEEEVKITSTLIDNLVKNAEEEIAKSIDEPAIAGSMGLHAVERATIHVQVNGYSVQDPIGLKGTTINLSHITGFVPEEVIEAIHEVQEKILPGATMSTHTYMLVVFCVLRDLFPKTQTLCIVDVTGETTEIGLVEEGVLLETRHVPYGSNTLIRKIAANTGGSTEDILSHLRAYEENAVHEGAEKVIEDHIAEYDAHMEQVFRDIQQKTAIPRTMVVTALPQVEKLFRSRVLQNAQKVTGNSFTSLEIQKNVLDEIAAKANQDTFISLASRFFHKLHGCGEIDTQ